MKTVLTAITFVVVLLSQQGATASGICEAVPGHPETVNCKRGDQSWTCDQVGTTGLWTCYSATFDAGWNTVDPTYGPPVGNPPRAFVANGL